MISEMREEPARTVLGVASYGGTRVMDMLVGIPAKDLLVVLPSGNARFL